MHSLVDARTVGIILTGGQINKQEQRSGKPAWKQLGCFSKKKGGRQANKYSSRPAKGQSSYKLLVNAPGC